MLELASELRDRCNTVFASFSEGGLCQGFLERARAQDFKAVAIANDTPHLFAAGREVRSLLRSVPADMLICHGYKAGFLGLFAARQVGIPVVAVSRGWTGESAKIRLYESIDRRILRCMDRVACVSHGQAAKVRCAGVRQDRTVVIHNAIRCERFDAPNKLGRGELESLLPAPVRLIVGAAGRLSPEKGFDVLVDAAADVLRSTPDVGFVLFGDGPLRESLQRQIRSLGLESCFILGGFRHDLDTLLPCCDLFTLPSHTEGLPNVVLEALAAGVPTVATSVGGTPEVLEDGINGYLVPAGDPISLASRLSQLLANASLRNQMAVAGRERVRQSFSFKAQADAYLRLFSDMLRLSSREGLSLAAAR